MKLKALKHYCLSILCLPSYLLVNKEDKCITLHKDIDTWCKRTKCNYTKMFMKYVYLMLEEELFRNIVYYRIRNDRRKIFRFSWLLPQHNTIFMLCDKIGGGLYISHGYGLVIYANEIGENFHAYQGVTIGMKNGKVPTIGNDVVCYANSIIIGNICVGNNVVIGAGAVVTKDLPDNCVVVGNPARIIRRNGIKVNEPL